MTRRLILLIFLASLLSWHSALSATDGTIPNQAFQSNEQWTIISPQMGTRHFNQPIVFNGYAILTGNAIHEVWDISNPRVPVRKATMISSYAAGEAESHQTTLGRDAAGNYYLATISGRGIDIWNMTNTTNPTLVSELILPGIDYGDVTEAVWGLCWQGDHIYCGATNMGLYVVDVSDVTSPSHVATLTRAQLGGVSAGPVFAMGDTLIVTTPKLTAGIATVDISDPENPALLDSISPSGGKSYIGGFYGKNAHLITPFRSYDVLTDPSNITAVGSAPVPNSEYLSFANDYLYLGGLRGGTEGIYKYDISNPASPVLLGRVQGRDSRWDDQFSCPVGNLLIIADDQLVDNQYVGAVIAVHETAADTSSISVKAVSPADGSTGISLSGQIGISLSEWPEFKSVDASSLQLRPLGGTAITGKWGCTYTLLNFTPDAPLLPGTTYEIFLPAGGVTDLVGNSISTSFLSTFTTALPGAGFAGDDDINAAPPIVLGNTSNFSVKQANPSRSYIWQFGDGTSYIGANASHIYSAPGRYAVQFRAENSNADVIEEAEDAVLSGGSVVDNSNAGYTGTGFVDYPSDQGAGVKITWSLESPAAITTNLTFRYALSSGLRSLNLLVNGGAPIKLDFTATGAWTSYADFVVANIALVSGANTIVLSADAGSAGPNIDHMSHVQLNPDADGDVNTVSFIHLVYRAPTSSLPTSSQPLLIKGDKVWAVNPDADSVTAVNKATAVKVYEIAVGDRPKAIAEAPDGMLWVICQDSANISVINPATATVTSVIPLPRASQPTGLAFAPDGSGAYVALQSLGQIVRIDPSSHQIVNTVSIGVNEQSSRVRGVAVNAASDTVYVTRFISADSGGEVYELSVDNATQGSSTGMSLTRTIALAKDLGPDSPQGSRGVPNYLTSITISPDGLRAWLPSKKDNIDRGGTRDGNPLAHDVTVRAITSTIDLSTGTEILANRIDFDNADRCHSLTFSPIYGDLLFVTLPGNDAVEVRDAYSGAPVTTLNTEHVPEGAVIDPTTGRIFILNFLSRSLSVYDVLDTLNGGTKSTLIQHIPLVSNEPLTPETLLGKQLFYTAKNTQINLEGYLSCASCHLNGSHDGRTYDFTAPMSEGFRNTIDLRGRSGTGHGRLHWSGNFDEIQDFEGQLRLLGLGTGLMNDGDFHAGTRSQSLGDPKTGFSSDLDALAAYVASLGSYPASPYRQSNGSLTPDAVLGKALFNSLSCFQCHGGHDFTDSALGALHNVGTIKATSGQRMGQTLTGIDTPTLRGIWDTAPYLHDGSAATLKDVITTANPDGLHGVTSTLTEAEINQLTAYLRQIDGSEPAANSVIGVDTQTFADFTAFYNLPEGANGIYDDADGDGFDNHTEWAMGGTDPSDAKLKPSTPYKLLSELSEDYFEISWLHRTGGVWQGSSYNLGNLLYTPQNSVNLNDWGSSLLTVPNPANLPPAPAGFEWATSRSISPLSASQRYFLRLKLN